MLEEALKRVPIPEAAKYPTIRNICCRDFQVPGMNAGLNPTQHLGI